MGIDRVETSAPIFFERHSDIARRLSPRRTDLDADIRPHGADKAVENVSRVAETRVKLDLRCPKMHQSYLKLFPEFPDRRLRRCPFVMEGLPRKPGQFF